MHMDRYTTRDVIGLNAQPSSPVSTAQGVYLGRHLWRVMRDEACQRAWGLSGSPAVCPPGASELYKQPRRPSSSTLSA